ncbi:MAG: hypothetical protein WCO84_00135 [bacterium]
MKNIDNQQAGEAQRTKKEIDDKMNDEKFLDFLKKNSDAVKNATDDEYLLKKIEVFENIKKARQEITKYITGESSVEFGGIVNDAFLNSIEDSAIKSPGDFSSFLKKIIRYAEVKEKSKKLMSVYGEVSKKLLESGQSDFEKMSIEQKRDFVKKVHDSIEERRSEIDKEKTTNETERSYLSYIPVTGSRKEWLKQAENLKIKLEEIRQGEKTLEVDTVKSSLDELQALNESFAGNQFFEIIRSAFKDEALKKTKDVIDSGFSDQIIENRGVVEKIRNNQSILRNNDFEAIEKEIRDAFNKNTEDETVKTVDQGKILSEVDKGVDNMRNKGLELGLSVKVCNEQIAAALDKKISDMIKASDPKLNINIILAKRILAKLR